MMATSPISHLPGQDERLVGLLTLELLDTWTAWVKRRVEAVSFPDVATQARHISVDFELPSTVLAAAARARRAREDHDATVDPDQAGVADVWVAGASRDFVLVPLTVMRKQGLTRFSLRDERGTALPLLTRDQTGAVATAVLVTFAEGIAATGDTLPHELRTELVSIATLPPTESTAVWEALDKAKGKESPLCVAWRERLVTSERFMAMALDLAQNFLLLTRVEAEPGRRRIIKISYEHHLLPTSSDATATAKLRRLRRAIGWGAHTERIDTPAVGLGRCFHLEVEAPEGAQVTRARLRTEPRARAGTERRARRYPDFPEAISDGRQRVHLHVSVPSSYTGHATVFMRPRPSTIVRAATLTAMLTTGLLTVVALRPTSFQTNLGAAAALLLIVPGGLSGYVARPREPHVATQMLLGLRLLALSCGLWAFSAAATLVAGRSCSDQSAAGSVCEYWSGTGYVIGGWAVCAFLAAAVLAIALRNTTHPPEQGKVPRWPGRSIAVVFGLVLGVANGVRDWLPDWVPPLACVAVIMLAGATITLRKQRPPTAESQ